MAFTITEPHPTVQANAYTHAGRGGLGNTFRAPTAVTPAAGVPTSLHKTVSAGSSASASSAHTAARFYAGRGGAGNAHPTAQRVSLSLDDEYNYAAAMAAAATRGHVGRGGAGNVAGRKAKKAAEAAARASKEQQRRKGSDAGSDASSEASGHAAAARSGFWARFRH